MIRFLIALVAVTACTGAGAPCVRHSDCASGACSAGGTCVIASDAGLDDVNDAWMSIPPLPIDASEAPVDAGLELDAPDGL